MIVYTNSWEVDGSTTITKHDLKQRADEEKEFLEEFGHKVIREVRDTSINPFTNYEYSTFKA